MTLDGFTNGKVGMEVDKIFGAGRMSLRPIDYGQLSGGHLGGHFRVAKQTNLVTGVAAAGALLSLRWTNPDRVFVLLRLDVEATLTTAFAAAQETSVDLVRVTTMLANDTGGLAVDLANDGRLAMGMQKSLISDLRVSDTAALGSGAGAIVETNPLEAATIPLGNVVGVSAKACLFDLVAGHDHPFELVAGQGLRVRNLTAQGAAGVVRFLFRLKWIELPGRFAIV